MNSSAFHVLFWPVLSSPNNEMIFCSKNTSSLFPPKKNYVLNICLLIFVFNAYDERPNHEKVNCMQNLIRNSLTAPDRLWLKVNCKKMIIFCNWLLLDWRTQSFSYAFSVSTCWCNSILNDLALGRCVQAHIYVKCKLGNQFL